MRTKFVLAMFCSLIATAVLPGVATTGEKITLKSGAVLVGSVTFDSGEIVVAVGESHLRLPLADIATISPSDSDDQTQGRRLLFRALEARLLGDERRGDTALLAEAYRLDATDPQIAFWYAFALEASGEGRLAEQVLEKHKEAIVGLYPGVSDQLAKRIDRRRQLERLPGNLTEQIDRLSGFTDSLDYLTADRIPKSAFFQLVDQHGKPVPESAVDVSGGGYNEQLIPYADGFFLHTVSHNRGSSRSEQTIRVRDPSFMEFEHKFTGATHEVRDLGQLVVHRFGEDDKLTVKLSVVDSEDTPISGAQASFRDSHRGANAGLPTVKTNDKGVAVVKLFPGSYYASLSAEGMKNDSVRIQLQSDDQENAITAKMWPAMSTRLQLDWEAEAIGLEQGGTTTGRAELELSDGRVRNDSNWPSWLKMGQAGGKCVLSIGDNRYGINNPIAAGSRWVRVARAKDSGESTYEGLSLRNLAALKEEGVKPISYVNERNRMLTGALSFEIEEGQIIYGETVAYVPHYQQPPVAIRFKAWVEEISVK